VIQENQLKMEASDHFLASVQTHEPAFAAANDGGNIGGGGGAGNVINSSQLSAPIYGHIVGCCGSAPNVHFYRKGQKCCVDGEIVDEKAPCSIEFM